MIRLVVALLRFETYLHLGCTTRVQYFSGACGFLRNTTIILKCWRGSFCPKVPRKVFLQLWRKILNRFWDSLGSLQRSSLVIKSLFEERFHQKKEKWRTLIWKFRDLCLWNKSRTEKKQEPFCHQVFGLKCRRSFCFGDEWAHGGQGGGFLGRWMNWRAPLNWSKLLIFLAHDLLSDQKLVDYAHASLAMQLTRLLLALVMVSLNIIQFSSIFMWQS